MSLAKVGRKLSEEHKQKISEKLKGKSKSWAGRKQSTEEIEKRRQKLIGHKTTESTRQKISLANKGKKLSTEQRQKISENNKGRLPWNKGLKNTVTKGRKCLYNPISDKLTYVNTNDVDKFLAQGWVVGNPKVSAVRKNKPCNNAKKIFCVETHEVFNTVQSAADWANVNVANIHRVLSGKSKTGKSGGYSWSYC